MARKPRQAKTLAELLRWCEGNRSALARGLGCSRAHVDKLEAQGFLSERYALPAGRLAAEWADRDAVEFAYQVLVDARVMRGEAV